eukprot:5495121-Pleurochrysis_carterae.AAC.2
MSAISGRESAEREWAHEWLERTSHSKTPSRLDESERVIEQSGARRLRCADGRRRKRFGGGGGRGVRWSEWWLQVSRSPNRSWKRCPHAARDGTEHAGGGAATCTSSARCQLMLPMTVLISPLWPRRRIGWASCKHTRRTREE